MEFSRQESWSGLLFPSPGYLPTPGIKLVFPAWQVDFLPLRHLERCMYACMYVCEIYIYIYIYIYVYIHIAIYVDRRYMYMYS